MARSATSTVMISSKRPAVFLAHRGAGVDQPTAANIAALIEVAAATPGRRILNIADPDAPSALQISRIIARQLDHTWNEILLDATADPGLGRSPWDAPHPIRLAMTAAEALGYTAVGDYTDTVADEIRWLVCAAHGDACADPVPDADDPFFAPLLDYSAEDDSLATSDPH